MERAHLVASKIIYFRKFCKLGLGQNYQFDKNLRFSPMEMYSNC